MVSKKTTKQEQGVITVNGVEYVRKDSVATAPRVSVANKKYVIARTYSAGVFAGHLKRRTGKEVVLQDARRIWYWKGAATLSQLAMQGTSDPDGCKFPMPVDEVILTEVIELLPCTKEGENSIKSVVVWEE